MNTSKAIEMGREHALTAINEGADSAQLACAREGADEALINAMGRRWVLEQAGAPDGSDRSWEEYGLPWCEVYSRTYRATAEALARADPRQAASHRGAEQC